MVTIPLLHESDNMYASVLIYTDSLTTAIGMLTSGSSQSSPDHLEPF